MTDSNIAPAAATVIAGIEIPADVQNVNTVQDAAKRLRTGLDIAHGDESRSYVRLYKLNLQAWIDHARKDR